MSAAPVSRALLRRHRLLLPKSNVRTASTTSETTSKAKDAASNAATKAQETSSGAVSKASQGLSRVQSSAGSAMSGAASSAQTLIPPTIYYTRVGAELSRLIFQGQKMAPPSISHFQSYFQPVTNVIRNPETLMHNIRSATGNASPESALNSVRNVNRQQLTTMGIVGAELLGFFTVGEMIGRMKLVGYRGKEAQEH